MQYEQPVALVPGFEPAAVAPLQPLGQVAPIELVAVAAEDKQKKSSSPVWLTRVVLCTIAFLLVATAVAAVILIGSLGGRDPPTDAADSTKPGGKRGRPFSSQDIEIVVNRPESDGGPKTPRYTGQWTPPPPPSKPSRVPYVPPAAPKEIVDKMPMVCIMGEKASTPDAFPDDGLCDYIFFDSLYKDGRNMLSRQATFSKSLSNFINNHPAYQGTHLGVGFSFNYLLSAEEDLKVKEPNPLQPLWDHGIFSVGIFDPPPMSLGNQTKAAIGTLKKIDDLLQMPKQLGHHVVTALAAPDPQLDWSLQYALDFSKVGFDPYIFIAIGHYTYGDNTVRNCAIMPPTCHPLDFPADDIALDYNYDLGTALFGVKEMSLRRTRLRPLVSVTLKGRWNVLRSSDKVEFFERCVSDPSANSFGSYTEVCPGRRSGDKTKYQLTYSEDHVSMLCHAPGSLRVFVYDNEDALAIKLCSIKNDEGFEDFKFGVAVYDIDYDDHDNECASLNRFGRQSRLKQVKQTLDYMRLHHGTSFDVKTCVDYKE